MAYYPPAGFHFRVEFLLDGITNNDVSFQEVSGLNVSVETEDYVEGGENRFVHKLPTRTAYADLELRRGLLLDSGITKWIQNAVDKFEFQPADLVITLLNEEHAPLASWKVVHAIPLAWTMDSFNAEENKLVIESMTLSYHYFKMQKES